MCVESEIRGDVTIGKGGCVPSLYPIPGCRCGRRGRPGVTGGAVPVGPRTVIHPKARIIAEAGPIVIGEGNLIEEQALIINGSVRGVPPISGDTTPPTPHRGLVAVGASGARGCVWDPQAVPRLGLGWVGVF